MTGFGRHAIVIGASMGGLLAARALADFYGQVTVLERDVLPTHSATRKGVPQGRHAHGLLAQGRVVLEGFFPGLTEDLVEQGAIMVDITDEAIWFTEGDYQVRFRSGLEGVMMSRPLLENQVRRRVVALPNVQLIENCDVRGLAADATHRRVTGVRLVRRAEGMHETLLEADLVVDASGRGSRVPAWLETFGYERPEELEVRVGVRYGTRLYRRTDEHLPGAKAVILAANPTHRRSGVLLAQENDSWILTVVSYLEDRVPTDEAGFLEFVRSLPTPEIYDVIKQAEPLSEIMSYNFPANQRRLYEKLARFPEGLLVFGDAICSFNPTYGQGMTTAALEAVALQESLAQGTEGLAPRFFKAASKVVDIPWSISVGNDLRFPEVEGERPLMMRFINWYIGKLHRVSPFDPVVSLAFHKVANLMVPPPTVLHPRIALRVLRGNLQLAMTKRRPATQPTLTPSVKTGAAYGD